MKSVCILTYNPFKYGGIERVVSMLANGLVKEYHVTLLCIDTSAPVDRSIYNLDSNVQIIFTDVNQYYHKYLHIFEKITKTIHQKTSLIDKNEKLVTYTYFNRHKKLLSNIKKIINENKFDYVIGANAFFSIILGMIKNDCESKMIGWQHSNYVSYFEKKGYYYYKQDIIAKKYFKNLDNYVTLIDYDKQIIKEKMGIDAVVIPNPKSFTSSSKSKLKNKQFIATGRFVDAKGFDLLIDSFYLFSKKNKEWNLIIVGDGENKEQMASKIDEYNLSNRITLHPFTKEVKELLLSSSVYLCSSRWEGFGLSVLEAMECGLPVISYNIPSMQEMLNNTLDLLVNTGDITSYSEKMLEVANYSVQELTNIAKKNNQQLSKYEFDNIIIEWKKILK